MSTTFPTTIDTFTTKVDNSDTILASHINNIQDSIVAIETVIGAGAAASAGWTPGFTGSTGAPTISYTDRGGYYVRLGGIVFVTGYIRLVSYTGGSGYLTLNGFPYACANNPYAVGNIGISYTAAFGATTAPRAINMTQGTATAALFTTDTSDARNNAGTPLVISALTSSSIIHFGGFYFA